MKHVVQVSGGKDPTALLLRALEHMEMRPGFSFLANFSDTGHEHPWTVDYVGELSEYCVKRGGPPITTSKADFSHRFKPMREHIRSHWPTRGVPTSIIERACKVLRPTGNPFLDICLLVRSFPHFRKKFCTRELKINPTVDQVYRPLWAQGHRVVSWVGVRAEESKIRQTLPRIGTVVGDGPMKVYRPLLSWTVRDVWLMIEKHGIKPNQLYRYGFDRVGCFPCIYANKQALRAIAERFPEAYDRLEEWETLVGKAQPTELPTATFFAAAKKDKSLRGQTIDPKKHGIRMVERWAKTSWGGRQLDLMPMDDIRAEFGTACDEWGTCE